MLEIVAAPLMLSNASGCQVICVCVCVLVDELDDCIGWRGWMAAVLGDEGRKGRVRERAVCELLWKENKELG